MDDVLGLPFHSITRLYFSIDRWERMQEDIAIVDVETIREISAHNPSEYILEESASWLSGDISSLASDDGISMTFRSYYSANDVSDFVDNNLSNVDSSEDKGTQVISQPRKKVMTQSMTLWKKQT